jgi:hypothetical protein
VRARQSPLPTHSILFVRTCLSVLAIPYLRYYLSHGGRRKALMSKSIESSCTDYLNAWSCKDLDGIAAHLLE